MQQQKIIILDFGSQTTQLIARRLRELDTFCEILPYNKFPVDDPDVIGVILSGSPYSVYDPEAFRVDLGQFRGRIPVLGICYGAQYISHTLGGRVEPAGSREYGRAHLSSIDLGDLLFRGFEPDSQVWMSHGDTITALPDGFHPIASTDHVRYAAYAADAEPVWGVQFHPEVFHSVQGTLLLRNFVVDICGGRQDWSPANFVEQTVEELRNELREEIASQNESVFPRLKESRALMALAERFEGEVPEGIVEDAEANLMQDFFNQLQRSGMTLDMYLQQLGITSAQFRDDIKEQARDMTKQDLAIDAYAAHAGIEASEDEVRHEFEEAGTGDPEALMEDWRRNGQLHLVRQGIIRQKAAKEIVDNAIVVEEKPEKAEEKAGKHAKAEEEAEADAE